MGKEIKILRRWRGRRGIRGLGGKLRFLGRGWRGGMRLGGGLLRKLGGVMKQSTKLKVS